MGDTAEPTDSHRRERNRQMIESAALSIRQARPDSSADGDGRRVLPVAALLLAAAAATSSQQPVFNKER